MICFAGWIIFSQPALAWGPAGHRIVGEIAQMNLTPRIERKIAQDFSIGNLADVANWADRIRSARPEANPWHYTNIQKGAKTYDRARDCPTGICLIEKISEFETVLKDPHRPQPGRVEALKYLVHLVADAHQPLHLGYQQDRGGNDFRLLFRGRPANLHALWDRLLIPLRPSQDLLEYSRRLGRTIHPREKKQWEESTVVDWANESRELVLTAVYSRQLHREKEVPEDYIQRSGIIIENQMRKAGVRLAHLLNRAMN